MRSFATSVLCVSVWPQCTDGRDRRHRRAAAASARRVLRVDELEDRERLLGRILRKLAAGELLRAAGVARRSRSRRGSGTRSSAGPGAPPPSGVSICSHLLGDVPCDVARRLASRTRATRRRARGLVRHVTVLSFHEPASGMASSVRAPVLARGVPDLAGGRVQLERRLLERELRGVGRQVEAHEHARVLADDGLRRNASGRRRAERTSSSCSKRKFSAGMTWSTIASATAVSATFAASLLTGAPTVHV